MIIMVVGVDWRIADGAAAQDVQLDEAGWDLLLQHGQDQATVV